MNVVDLGQLGRAPNLVTEFAERAESMIPPGMADFDGTLLDTFDGHCLFFQFFKGKLSGCLVMSAADAVVLAQRILDGADAADLQELQDS